LAAGNLWAATVVSDSFTEAGDTAITSHTPDTGTGWTEVFDDSSAGTDAQVIGSSDTLAGGSDENSVGQAYTAQPDPSGVDQDITFTLKALDTTTGTKPIHLFGRRTDNSNFYHVQLLPNTNAKDSVKLYKYVAGVATELDTSDETLAVNDVIKLEIRDATKKVYINAVEILSSADNALTSAGTWGIAIGDYNGAGDGAHLRSTWEVDDFLAEEPTTTIDISGTSDLASGTVKVAVNTTLQGQSTTIAAGAWSITGVTAPSAGDVVTVFVDGAADADESTGVTKYDGTGNITGMVLNQHVLTIGSDDNPSLTVTNLGQYDYNDDEDIMHTANAGVFNTDGGSVYADDELSVISGATLNLSGTETLTTVDFTPAGTFTSTSSGTITVNGNLTNTGSSTFGSGNLTINGNFAMSTGTVDGGSGTIDLNGDFSMSNGMFASTSGYFYVQNDFDVSSGTFTHNSGTVRFETHSNETITTNNATFNNLVMGLQNISANNTLTLGDDFTVDGNLTIDKKNGQWIYYVYPSGTRTINLKGDLYLDDNTSGQNGSVFGNSNLTVIFSGITDQAVYEVSSKALIYANVVVDKSGGVLKLGSNFYFRGSFEILSGNTFDVSNDNGSTVYEPYFGSTFTNAGTFNVRTSTVNFKTLSNAIITTGGVDFYNLKFDNIGTGGSSHTATLIDDFTVTGDLTVDKSSTGWAFAISPSGTRTINLEGNFYAKRTGSSNMSFGNSNLTLNFMGNG
ncbi:MAG: hypothetical protein KC713_09515, partial [Candidatus Omnitrophica bacterium]|nr:hypothetical protein [Candidatus Omnitrophota bacterium]